MNQDNEVPDVVTLTLDTLIDGPDWSKIRAAAKEKNVFPDTLAAIKEIEAIWENPEADHLTMVTVRDGKTLVITDGPGETPRYHRLMVDRLKRLEVLEAGGFDGKLAAGTSDRLFCEWYTPDVIRDEINHDDELDYEDFEPEAIEDAIRHMVCHNDGDWTFEHVCQVRSRIIEIAKNESDKLRAAPVTVAAE